MASSVQSKGNINLGESSWLTAMGQEHWKLKGLERYDLLDWCCGGGGAGFQTDRYTHTHKYTDRQTHANTFIIIYICCETSEYTGFENVTKCVGRGVSGTCG